MVCVHPPRLHPPPPPLSLSFCSHAQTTLPSLFGFQEARSDPALLSQQAESLENS